jgi:hypothetical protein
MTQHRTSLLLRASALLLVAANAVTAQTLVRETKTDSAPGVPRGMMPPSGKCRVWMEGVPATRQPAPTDCATALRQKPSNARVIYGPNTADQRQAGLDAARGEKRSLLTPIGERRPSLGVDRAAAAASESASPSLRRGQAAVRSDTPSTRGTVATPTNRTLPDARQATPPARVPETRPKAPPPKKPERP